MSKSTSVRVNLDDEAKLDHYLLERGISKTFVMSKLLNWFVDLPDTGKMILLDYVQGSERAALVKILILGEEVKDG